MIRASSLRYAWARPSSLLSQATRFLSTEAKSEKLFDKILIANRGEISCRVIRSCKKLGIKTVAIYSDPDANSLHVALADEAIRVGPAASGESYLNVPNILKAIRDTGAQAVHPGYGFLSENKDFCKALKDEGVVFIGPDVHAIHAMGDKIQSKEIAIKAGVNTIPGYQDVLKDEEECVRISNQIGYPVMIKATAGGGGKGMRIAYNDDEAREGFRLSSEESWNAFADDRLFVEKYIEDPRHIEIQLIADGFGNVATFPERECSIQRRNQKVIEEAPSTLLDAETRKKMQDQAAMLAKAVGYKSAGTVEMLCDKHKNFYFLEMNTRLQVEHPVTEMISGVDLVEQMIRVAAGYPLPQELLDGIKIHGWAIESRVYAEDPLRGFLPSIGRLMNYQEPLDCPGVRCDSGIVEGSEISMFYDPMISKLITHGKNRIEAIDRMEVALDNYIIRGPGNNVTFLRDMMRHPRFRAGKITTKFIPEEYPKGFHGVTLHDDESRKLFALGAVMLYKKLHRARTITGRLPSYKDQEIRDLYCLKGGPFGEVNKITFEETDGNSYHVTVHTAKGETERISIDNLDWPVDGLKLTADVNGEECVLQLLSNNREGFTVQFRGAIEHLVLRTHDAQAAAKYMIKKPEVDRSKYLQCPMPGTLVSLAVQEGDEVEIGQELCVVEAMKMQNILRSPKHCKVKKISVKQGVTLKVDQVMMEFEPLVTEASS